MRALFAWAWYFYSSSAYLLDPPRSFEEAVEEIAALRQLITELKSSLHECTVMTRGLRGVSVPSEEGCDLDEVTSVVRGDSNWHVDDGACLLEDDCITSPSFPENYAAGQRCVITIGSNWTGVLDLREFSVTLHSDYLTVNGASYSDSYTLTHSRMQGTVPTGNIVWSSSPYSW